jgi:hypothetical protein
MSDRGLGWGRTDGESEGSIGAHASFGQQEGRHEPAATIVGMCSNARE